MTSRSTYAYPTTVTDAGGYSSTIKYRFDTGANVWAQSPTPYGDSLTSGKTTSREYDDTIGRIVKEKIENSGAYTRYSYATSGNALATFSTIIDVNNDNAVTSADEVESDSYFDGAGRVIATKTPHNFTTNTWSATVTQYDILGRVFAVSVPTEVSISSSTWTPAGDDATRGFVYNKKYYDWKGRTLRTVPSDSTSDTDGKDTLISYAGCGCAGSQVTTIKGPKVDAYGMTGSTIQTNKRRWQKITEDILGRPVKTEMLDLDGADTYSTLVNTYNGRDQVTNARQYSGTSSSSTFQDTVTSYDGHGRPVSLHKPEFYTTFVTNPTYATTTYNTDDTIATTTDPRGSVTTFTYGTPSATEKRNVLTKVEYTPVSGVEDTPDVTLTYDNAGNRMSMSDGTGTLAYKYDEMSRLVSETKVFADTLSKGLENGYRLSYQYNLNGSLKSIENPFGYSTTYAADKLGRTISVGASGDGPVSGSDAFAANINYRAFGGVKSMSINHEAPTTVSATYDSALRAVSYQAQTNSTSAFIRKAAYNYDNDGEVKDVSDSMDHKFDQVNEYDFAGRLKKNDVGHSGATYPFSQTMSYDAFSNLSARTTNIYQTYSDNFTATYSNNRKSYGSNGSDIYDSAGNVTSTYSSSGYNRGGGYNDYKYWHFDAAGRMTKWQESGPWGSLIKSGEAAFDGDGRVVKQKDIDSITWYHVISSVTGQMISDLIDNGVYLQSHVYLGRSSIATIVDPNEVSFKYTDPVTGGSTGGAEGQTELAGFGTSVPLTAPASYPPPIYGDAGGGGGGGYGGDAEGGCYMDGLETSPSMCSEYINRGWAVQCPDNNCGSRVATDGAGHYKLTMPFAVSGSQSGFSFGDGTAAGTAPKPGEKPPTLKKAKKRSKTRTGAKSRDDSRDSEDDTAPSFSWVHGPSALVDSYGFYTPRCTVTVAGKGTQVGDEMELAGGTDLGAVSQLGFGVRFQVEISAHLTKTYPQTAEINQTVTSNSYIWQNDKSVVKQFQRINEDDTNEDRNYYDGKNGVAYSNDAPGMGQSPDARLEATGLFQGNFTSFYQENGEILCSVEWHVRISAIYGKITSVDFGNGHINF